MGSGLQMPGSVLDNRTKLLLHCALSCREQGAGASLPCPSPALRTLSHPGAHLQAATRQGGGAPFTHSLGVPELAWPESLHAEAI